MDIAEASSRNRRTTLSLVPLELKVESSQLEQRMVPIRRAANWLPDHWLWLLLPQMLLGGAAVGGKTKLFFIPAELREIFWWFHPAAKKMVLERECRDGSLASLQLGGGSSRK